MPKFQIQPVILDGDVQTARLGSASGSANYFADTEVGKIVKLAGESRFNLTVAGEHIEGFVDSVNVASQDDFSIGGVQRSGNVRVTFDGLQATPGTGTVAVGDFVVTGTVVARATSLAGVPARVTKATVQIGSAPADLAAAGVMARAALYAWRIVSLGAAGTGAVGTTGVIKRICS